MLFPLCYYLIPNDKVIGDDHSEKFESKAKILKFLTNKPILITFVVYILNSSSISYLEPLLTEHLETYGLSTVVASTLFGIAGVTYIPCLFLSSYFPKSYDQRLMIIFGMFFVILSQLFCGPDN